MFKNSIVHRSKVRKSTCSACGQRLAIDPRKPYAMALSGSGPVCLDCGAKACPELAAIFRAIPDSDQPANHWLSIALASRVTNTRCPNYPDRPFPARDWDIVTDSGQRVSVLAGQEYAGPLAAALHAHFSSQAEIAPAPPSPPTESPEVVARRRRAERREEAIKLIAHALQSDPHNPSTRSRAAALLDAIAIATD